MCTTGGAQARPRPLSSGALSQPSAASPYSRARRIRCPCLAYSRERQVPAHQFFYRLLLNTSRPPCIAARSRHDSLYCAIFPKRDPIVHHGARSPGCEIFFTTLVSSHWSAHAAVSSLLSWCCAAPWNTQPGAVSDSAHEPSLTVRISSVASSSQLCCPTKISGYISSCGCKKTLSDFSMFLTISPLGDWDGRRKASTETALLISYSRNMPHIRNVTFLQCTVTNS